MSKKIQNLRPQTIKLFFSSQGIKPAKDKLEKECPWKTKFQECFGYFVLHQIGLANITLAKSLHNKYVTELAKDPFIYKTFEYIYGTYIVPGINFVL